ncbi:MAG: LysR family transcriptional regulator [Eubacteriales bacterium]
MTLRHLKIFVTVCECNSMTIAAEKLFLTQPAVSLAISELETNYGIKLFDRISRKLYITDQGKQLLTYASQIVSIFDEMEKGVKDWDSIGTLRIGSSITIGNHLLMDYIKIFKSKYPNIKTKVIIDNSEKIENEILENKIDFALIEGIVHNDQIKYENFMEDRLVLFCGTNHPLFQIKEIKIQDLPKYDFILREKGSGGREFFDSVMTINDINIKPLWESMSTQAIIRAVIEGFGLSVLPLLMIKKHLQNNEVHEIKINNIELYREFYLIYHKNKFLTNSAKEFIKILNNQEN